MKCFPQNTESAIPDQFRQDPTTPLLIHIPTGIIGKQITPPYTPTGKPVTIQIRTLDNRIYFAPLNEFDIYI